MPWKESSVVSERERFVADALAGDTQFSELCEIYGISRKTGYKWLNRFKDSGYRGLKDQTRRPQSNSNSVDEDAIIEIIKLKNAHPTWGPKKIKELVIRNLGEDRAASLSSVHRVLRKAGLVKKRRVRQAKPGARIQHRIQPEESNDVWTVDFKGWWMSKDLRKCSPLTIRDEKSKFVIRTQHMATMNTAAVRAVFESAFKEYGLPKVMRSDNGTPFASQNGLMGLSKLSVWWLTLGILPDRIDPGQPSQNGGHERMHRDLKAEVQDSVAFKIAESQAALDAWRQEFNEVRPHEALGMKTPAEVYTPSPRKYEAFDELEYPEGFLSRKVSKSGAIKVESRKIQISSVFAGYNLGLKPIDESNMQVWLGEFYLGNLDIRLLRYTPEGFDKCVTP